MFEDGEVGSEGLQRARETVVNYPHSDASSIDVKMVKKDKLHTLTNGHSLHDNTAQ